MPTVRRLTWPTSQASIELPASVIPRRPLLSPFSPQRLPRCFSRGKKPPKFAGAIAVEEASGHARTERLCDLLLAHGEAVLGTGARAVILNEVAPAALAIAEELGDEVRAFEACRLVISATDGVPPHWLAAAERHVNNDPSARIAVNISQAAVALHDGRYADCRRLLKEGLEIARDRNELGSELSISSFAIRVGALPAEEEGRVFQRLLALPREGLAPRDRANVSLDCLMAHLESGDRERAEAERRGLSELVQVTQHRTPAATLAGAEALFQMIEGRLDEAMKSTRDANLGTFPHAWRSRLAGWLGQADVLEEERSWNRSRIPTSKIVHESFCLAQLRRISEAQAALATLPSRFVQAPDGAISRGLVGLILEAVSMSEDKDHASAVLALMSGSRRYFLRPNAVLLPRHLGRLSALLGEYDNAEGYYNEAIDFCEGLRYRPELALTRLDFARMLLTHSGSRRKEAHHHLDLAIPELEAMSMWPALEAASLLRGSRLAIEDETQTSHPDGLTDREVEVLRLITAGQSNREIADSLVLSVRTVERHIANIYAKIGTHTKGPGPLTTLIGTASPREFLSR